MGTAHVGLRLVGAHARYCIRIRGVTSCMRIGSCEPNRLHHNSEAPSRSRAEEVRKGCWATLFGPFLAGEMKLILREDTANNDT